VVPPALLTPRFAAEVARVLRPRGIHVLNVVDAPPLDVARGAARALLEAFGSVAVVAPRKMLRSRGHGNVVLVASSGALPVAALRARAAASPDREEVLDGAEARAFASA
jgi:spermidine synthase